MSNALKAISSTPDELRVGNYIILYGGRDLEGLLSDRRNADGTAGEFFTAATNFDSQHTKSGTVSVNWEHGYRELPADEVLGTVDWSTVKADAGGLFVERVLYRRSQYVKLLEPLIEAGLIGSSSEAMEEGIEKKANGEIVRWPLIRDTLTVNPMEPRMMKEFGDNVVSALKALNIELPESQPEPEVTPEAEQAVVTAKAADKPEELSKQEDTMSEEKKVETPAVDVGALVAKAVADGIAGYKAELAKAPPTSTPGLVVIEAEEDKLNKAVPFTGLGEFLMAVKNAGPGAIDRRLLALRNAEDGYSLNGALGDDFVGSITKSAYRQKAVPTGLGEGLGSTGGFLLQGDRRGGILARVYDVGELLQRVSMDGLSADSNSLTINAEDETSRADGSRRGGVQVYWGAEAGAYTASKPSFRQIELKLKKLFGLVYATDEQLADASALESYIMRVLPEEMRFKVEDGIINGTGTGQLKGILATGPVIQVAKETGQSADTITYKNIIGMWARMWARSRRNAIWLYEQSCEVQLMQMSLPVGTGGVAVYTPPGGASAAPYGTIFGRPAIAHESCAAVGTVGDIMLIDPTEYQMIEKGGIQTASSIHVAFTTGEQLFRFTYRCAGEPLWASALTPKSGGDTLSPFVALAERA